MGRDDISTSAKVKTNFELCKGRGRGDEAEGSGILTLRKRVCNFSVNIIYVFLHKKRAG